MLLEDRAITLLSLHGYHSRIGNFSWTDPSQVVDIVVRLVHANMIDNGVWKITVGHKGQSDQSVNIVRFPMMVVINQLYPVLIFVFAEIIIAILVGRSISRHCFLQPFGWLVLPHGC